MGTLSVRSNRCDGSDVKDVKDDAVDDVGYGGSPIGGASPAYFPGNPPQMSTENGIG